jgi:hypothetical protein
MEIRSVGQFLEYWDSLRGRTRKVVACIPPEQLEWSPSPSGFTLVQQIPGVRAGAGGRL